VRIGIDAGTVVHGRGGVASSTREIVRSLAGPEVDHEIVLFDLEGRVPRRVVFEQVLGPLPRRVSVGSGTRDELEDLDLFHAPSFRMPPPGARRHIFTLHDLTVLSHPECHTLANRVRTMTAVAEALVRGATLMAVSRATRDEARRLLCVPSEAVEVVPPMVSSVFTPGNTPVTGLESEGAPQLEQPYVLTVGSLEPRKNMDRVIDAWELLPEALRRSHLLVVVGPYGWRQHRVRRRLRAAERRGSVVPMGFVPAPVLAALYRRARAFVFPSLAEGFGLPVLEAMGCGAPVITSSRSSMPDVAGDAALLVEPENVEDLAAAVQTLLEDGDLRRRLRSAGFEQSRKYAPQVVLRELLAAYQRAAAAG
jgi:alpha-1,3-rhamnosyl/mannosyltransferase